MGRPPLKRDTKVRQQTVWLHQDLVDRIVALVGPQGISAFMRRAAEALLEREEAEGARSASGSDRETSTRGTIKDGES